MMVKESDLAWLAGFIDGEGSITIAKRKRQKSINYNYDLQLRIINTDKSLLDHCQSIIGKGEIKAPLVAKATYKQSWSWSLWANSAKEALIKVSPYLVGKQMQAKLGIELQDNINMGKKLRPGGRYQSTPRNEIEIREHLFKEMKQLNKRGS